jgi:hypothetical protein
VAINKARLLQPNEAPLEPLEVSPTIVVVAAPRKEDWITALVILNVKESSLFLSRRDVI